MISPGMWLSTVMCYASLTSSSVFTMPHPAHSKDINRAIFENPDLEVLTSNGGERRKAHTISGDDVLRLKRQMSFPSLWRKP